MNNLHHTEHENPPQNGKLSTNQIILNTTNVGLFYSYSNCFRCCEVLILILQYKSVENIVINLQKTII